MNTARGRFVVRWFVSAFGLWIASELLGSESISFEGQFGVVC